VPNRVADLPSEREHLQRPVVYHLLGRCSASPTYVISDEDTLEFVCALQSEHLTPEKLFHELEHNHLLIIGSNFSNWLARLFLRMAKRRRLSDPRDVGEVLADDHSDGDERLMAFLQQVSVRTRVYSGAEQFVNELHSRWLARRRVAEKPAVATGPQRFLPPEREMPPNAVFISYAREDLAAVQRLKSALDAAGVRTWFDMERLEGGDDYDQKIQKNIARCSYFVPVVSANTERRLEGYFRREWSYAIDRTRNMADGAIFILPVCIDGTDAARVPDKFRALHITAAPGGEPPPGLVQAPPGTPRRPHVMSALAEVEIGGATPVDALERRRRAASVARPRLVQRGDAPVLPRPRGGSRRARAARAAQDAHRSSSGNRASARLPSCGGHRAALAQGRLTVRCTCASTTRASRRRHRSRSSRRSFARPRPWASGRSPGSAVPGRSLWEFLHHRDDVLIDERGNTLIPLVIFDQFEEIFTLGQMDDFGRARAAEFIEDLADLVENRPPRAIESMLETEDSIVERFDFNRAGLPHPHRAARGLPRAPRGLKASMPSITQNRMRLARMTGHQALAAVVKPGGKLVSEEVAESIVRFVGRRLGAAQRRGGTVAPFARLPRAQQCAHHAGALPRSPPISWPARATRSSTSSTSARRPTSRPGVRRFIEDEMLTESGFARASPRSAC
jgi:hypothetical protein